MLQRGAMFGLDARLALVIFTTLSTFTGFVLYQRAEEAQDIKLYADLKEMELALKLMQRDFGVLPGHANIDGINAAGDDMFAMFCNPALVAPAFQKRWKGPYLNSPSCATSNDGTYKNLTISFLVAYATPSGVSSLVPPGNSPNMCTSTNDCYAWLGITANQAFFDYLNRVVDEQNGSITELSPEDNGRVILHDSHYIWYRTEVHK